MRALILAAGKGTRLGLRKTPKCMVKVNGKPILEHLVNHLNKHGITEIIVNIHKDYDKIFRYFGTRLLYLYEPTLLGEAGTEKLLSNWLGDEYIVMNGDTLTNIDLKALTSMNFGRIFWNCKSNRYAGTKYVLKRTPFLSGWVQFIDYWDGDGAYYFDCGTKAKLAKARRFFKK